MNNFHIMPNQYEIGVLQGDIFKTIKAHNYTQINQLVDHYCDSPEYLTIITSKPGLFTSYINSMWRKNNPNGRVQYTHELTSEELKNFLNTQEDDYYEYSDIYSNNAKYGSAQN